MMIDEQPTDLAPPSGSMSLMDDMWDLLDQGVMGQLAEKPRDFGWMAEDREDAQTPSITEVDFVDGPERKVFVKLKNAIRACCNVNTETAARMKAAEWIFVPGLGDNAGLTFSEICTVLGARDYLLQIRIQHQFWLARIPFPEALPFLAAGIPESIVGEILYHFGESAYKLALMIWRWPGIRADRLLALARKDGVDDDEYHKILRHLDAGGYIAIAQGFWYFISRNPSELSVSGRRRFSWAYSIL